LKGRGWWTGQGGVGGLDAAGFSSVQTVWLNVAAQM